MSFFIFPQGWIGPAIGAAAIAFGTIGHSVDIKYKKIPGRGIGAADPPHTIIIDKRPAKEWTRQKAQCLLAHEYAHLAGFRDSTNEADHTHSDNPRSLMYPVLAYEPCVRWLRRNGLE